MAARVARFCGKNLSLEVLAIAADAWQRKRRNCGGVCGGLKSRDWNADEMESCNCVEPQWPADDLLMRYQYISDFFIALTYFSIPVELIYFVKKSSIFPYRWVLVQFGAFIVLCGATHLINLWTFSAHTRVVAVVLTVAKIFTGVVSCATSLMLVHIIPDLLSVKTRELFLKNKAAELDREMGLIRKQEETGRHVRMPTHEIRSTLDKNTILKTTLVELGKTRLKNAIFGCPARMDKSFNSHIRCDKP